MPGGDPRLHPHAEDRGAHPRSPPLGRAPGRRLRARSWRRSRRTETGIGLTFQIVDDILDVEGSLETLGKTAGKDQRQQKITYPGLHGLAASKARAAALTREAHAALAPLGPAAEPLRALADFILNRRA